MESERTALKKYKEIIRDTLRDLPDDEAACAPIYALAYIADMTSMINQMKTDRRNCRLASSNIGLRELAKIGRIFRISNSGRRPERKSHNANLITN